MEEETPPTKPPAKEPPTTGRRKSRRAAGADPEPPPSPSTAGAKTQLKGLLATDCRHGRAYYGGSPSRAWNLEKHYDKTLIRELYDAADESFVRDIRRRMVFEEFSDDDDDDDEEEEDDRTVSSELTTTATVVSESTSALTEPSSLPSLDDAGAKLIPFSELKKFVESSCCCKTCHADIEVTQETWGMATNICITCESRKEVDGRRTIRHSSIMTAERIDDNASRDSASNYIVNMRVVIAMQMLGLGLQSVTMFLGLLGIRHSIGNKERWKKIQDLVGEAEAAVSSEVLVENQKRAIEAAKAAGKVEDPAAGNRVGLVCSIDGAWQTRSSGRKYDSPSGHNLLVCCRTKLILQKKVFSKLCALCDRADRSANVAAAAGNDDAVDSSDEEGDDDIPAIIPPVKDHRCPRNYKGSSKAMESYGAVDLVTQAWHSNTYFVETVVGDDDSTSRAALTINLKQYGDDHPDLDKDDYWPRKPSTPDGKKGAYIDNKGKLDWRITAPTEMLCDPTHRTRVIGSKLFELAARSGSTKVTRADALRMKRNYGYAHKQARDKTFNEYKIAINGALYHHGNDHRYCDPSWCNYAAGKKDPANNKRSIIIGTDKWNQIKEVHEYYTTNDLLRMCHHPYDSQKNESLNTRVATYAPKTKTFCTTKSLEDRVDLVIIIDSIGYSDGVGRIINKVAGRNVAMPAVVSTWLVQQDRSAKWKKEYQEKTTTKKRRAKKIQDRIKQSLAEDKKAEKQGMYYTSGVATKEDENPLQAHKRKLQEMEDATKRKKQEKEEKAARKAARKAAKTTTTADDDCCPYCKGKGHKTWRSKKCGEHQRFLEQKSETEDQEKGPNKKQSETSLSTPVGEGMASVDASPKQNT